MKEMKYILIIACLLAGCSVSPKSDVAAEFDKRFASVTIGMSLSEALTILKLDRHEIAEIEHPDGRLIHTKLYQHTVKNSGDSATWRFKTDGSGNIIEKSKDIEQSSRPYR